MINKWLTKVSRQGKAGSAGGGQNIDPPPMLDKMGWLERTMLSANDVEIYLTDRDVSAFQKRKK